MKNFVKSAYGNSSTYFMNTFLRKILGLLQGSSDVGPIWTLNSSVQFQVLDQLHPPAQFPSPCPQIYTKRNAEGFVDDVTCGKLLKTNPFKLLPQGCRKKPKPSNEESMYLVAP
jgi:hypothetical protein